MNGLNRGDRLYDGFTRLDGGMDAASPPDDAAMANRTAFAVNCVHRGGYVTHRPALVRHELVFSEQEDIEEDFKTGLFQGAAVYYPDNNPPTLVLSVSGRLFQISAYGDYSVDEVTPADGPDNSLLTRVWFFQAERWLIKQNGVDQPVIFDGGSSRRPAEDEIKCGTCGVYAWGRIWYALPDGHSYRATDIVYGQGNREDVLKETECEYLTGANFVVPSVAGRITAIVVPGMLDNATGQGPIHVFTENSVFSCNAPLDRDTWLDMTNPIQTISQNQHGALSDRSCVVVNGDIFMRAIDGIRSYAIARRNFGTWANTPISREVDVFLRYDSRGLLSHSSGCLYDNRLLMTCSPQIIDGQGVVHNGLVVMDFDPVASFRETEPPVWDGLWTGLKIHQVLTASWMGEQRCFVIGRNADGEIELWEFSKSSKLDNEAVPIEWSFAPRQMAFDTPLVPKRLLKGELWIDSLDGTALIIVKYKPDEYPVPLSWASWSECAMTTTCQTEAVETAYHPYGCLVLQARHPQYRTRMELPAPSETCNEATDADTTVGYKFQPIISVKGSCRIKAMRLTAYVDVEAPHIRCDDEACKTVEGCDIDPFEYQIEEET